MATSQVNPESLFNFKMQFDTTNLDNGTLFQETHVVTFENAGAFQAINIPGSRIIIPLTTNTGVGSYWIKVHLPQPNSSNFYVTFCQRTTGGSNPAASTYSDYVNGIPAAYRTALKTFIQSNNPVVLQNGTYPLSVTFIFSVYGADTNQPAEAQEYHVRFTGIFGTSGGGGTTGGASANPNLGA